jgi:type IV secretory pathway TraG/TraD family ATPase VirD4
MNKENQKSKTKSNWIDSSDVFSNSFQRMAKHLVIPSAIGLLGGILLVYIVSVLNLSNFKAIHFEGLWKALVASLANSETFVIRGKEVATDLGLKFFEIKALDSLSTIIILFTIGFLISGGAALYLKIKISKKHAEKYLEDQHLKGTNILTEEELTEIQKKDKIQGCTIGNTAKLDENLECSHVFVAGSSGTGKTVLLNQAYYWQKKNRPDGRWIIHDTKGDWIEKFYNPETDYIFNFNDKRSINFNVFDAIKTIPDIKVIVATIIPRNPEEKDPVWTDTARDLLEGCLLHCIKYDNKNNIAVKNLIKLKVSALAKELKTVEGAEVAVGHLTSSETQAGNFMSNFRSKAAFFTTIPDNESEKEIDIKEWLLNKEGGQSTIFLLNDTKNKDLNAIRISVFTDTFIKTFLSLEESKTRRVYFLLDELGSLAKMPSLVDGLALLRSFGGSFWIGIQEIQRLYSIYGKDLTSTIVNNTASKIILRAQEVETQKFCSDLIGEKKFKSSNITNSTGSEINANREGASFATQEKIEKAILPSEIANMKNNTYYYKNGQYDWTFIKKEFTELDNYPKFNKAFIEREDLDLKYLFSNSNSNKEQEQDEQVESKDIEEEKDTEEIQNKNEDNEAIDNWL